MDIQFDYEKLTKKQKATYDKLTGGNKTEFEKQWLIVERQKQKAKQMENRLKEKQNKLKADQNKKERKERTRRLIQLGGVVEKYCGEIEHLEAFENYIKQYANAIKKNQREYTPAGSPAESTAETFY